jgi:two-component system CheB/CheR fusion protein
MPPAPAPAPATAGQSSPRAEDNRSTSPVVYVIDDDGQVLEELRGAIAEGGLPVNVYGTAEAFLEAYRPGREACVLIDVYLPGMSGLELLRQLKGADSRLTTIMITGHSDVQMAVQAMMAGASDFIEKPIDRGQLLASVGHALERSADAAKLVAWREDAARRLAELTPRQRQIMRLILAGHPNKNIAADLGISQRTVENHRAEIMKRTDSKSLPALARLALAAAGTDAGASLSGLGGASSGT